MHRRPSHAVCQRMQQQGRLQGRLLPLQARWGCRQQPTPHVTTCRGGLSVLPSRTLTLQQDHLEGCLNTQHVVLCMITVVLDHLLAPSLRCTIGFFGTDCSLSYGTSPTMQVLDGQGYTSNKRGPNIYIYELPPEFHVK